METAADVPPILRMLRQLVAMQSKLGEYLVSCLETERFDAFGALSREYGQLKLQFGLELMNQGVLSVAGATRKELKILRHIKTRGKLPFEEKWEGVLGPDIFTVEALDWDEEPYRGWAETHLVGPFMFHIAAEALLKISVLIVPSDEIPEYLGKVIHEARICYAYERYLALHVLCRVIVDLSIQDICDKCQIETRSRKDPNRTENLSVLLDRLSEKQHGFHLSISRVKSIVNDLNRIVHGSLVSNSSDAMRVFGDTIDVVGEFYELLVEMGDV